MDARPRETLPWLWLGREEGAAAAAQAFADGHSCAKISRCFGYQIESTAYNVIRRFIAQWTPGASYGGVPMPTRPAAAVAVQRYLADREANERFGATRRDVAAWWRPQRSRLTSRPAQMPGC